MLQSDYFQVIFGFLSVVIMILLFAWFYKKIGGMKWQSNPNLKIIEALSLGVRDKIVLLQAGDKQILVGLSQGNIRTLYAFDEAIIDAKETQGDFLSTLKQAMRKG